MRDLLKNEYYFEQYISEEKARFIEFKEIYDEATEEYEKQKQIAGYLAGFCRNMFTAKYSLGCDKQELRQAFKEYVTWVHICKISNYAEYADMIALSILFDIQYEDIKDILEQQQFSDTLTDCLIGYLKTGFYVINQPVELRFPNAYSPFTDFLVDKDIEQFIRFMDDSWYHLNQDAYWYDSHKNQENIYAGYWCWLAAAVLKMVGMTVEGKYIPGDLI